MRPHGVVLALTLVSLVNIGSTAAQPAPPDPGEVAYQEGRRHFDLREWDEAIAKFKEAYRLRQDAASLFNIAQSYRLKGDCVEALGFYKTYKRNFPATPNIATVEKWIKELEPCAAQRGAGSAPTGGPMTTRTTPPSPGPPSAPAEPEPIYEDRGRTKRMIGLVVGGAGVALVGTGFVFGMLAKSEADKIDDADGTTEWDPGIDTRGKRYDLMATIAWGVGGAAVVTGTVMFVLGKKGERTPIALVPMPGGGLVTAAGRF